MQIFILNGGLGRRVKKLSKDKPKCLINFNNKPFLYHQYKLLKKKGFKSFVFCLGYKSNKIIEHIKKNKYYYKNIKFSVEKKKLDTGGALLNAYSLMDDYFFVTYGDSFLDIDYKKILTKFKKTKKKCLITINHKKYNKYHAPNIYFHKNNIKAYTKSKKSNYIDYGVLIFKKSFFDKMLIKNISLKSLLKSIIKQKLFTFEKIHKKFYEIGSLHGINEFKKKISKNEFY